MDRINTGLVEFTKRSPILHSRPNSKVDEKTVTLNL